MTDILCLRSYCATDFVQCIAIFDSNTPKYFAPHERADFAQFIQTTTDPYFVVTLVADRKGEGEGAEQIIGCGGYFLRNGGTVAGFSWGMVANDHHGTGAGRFLMMARLQRICQGTAAQSVVLNTSQHTYGFFAKVGFVVGKITKDGFAPGLDDYEMTLDLQGGWCAERGYGR
jgi:hypothetical protein